MRNELAIDSKLLRKAKKISKSKSDQEVINRALEALIRSEKTSFLMSLIGSGKTKLSLNDIEQMRLHG